MKTVSSLGPEKKPQLEQTLRTLRDIAPRGADMLLTDSLGRGPKPAPSSTALPRTRAWNSVQQRGTKTPTFTWCTALVASSPTPQVTPPCRLHAVDVNLNCLIERARRQAPELFTSTLDFRIWSNPSLTKLVATSFCFVFICNK